jgi:hypothetical protein
MFWASVKTETAQGVSCGTLKRLRPNDGSVSLCVSTYSKTDGRIGSWDYTSIKMPEELGNLDRRKKTRSNPRIVRDAKKCETGWDSLNDIRFRESLKKR